MIRAVVYCTIFNRIKPHPYLIFVFLTIYNPSPTLAVSYFSIFIITRPKLNYISAFSIEENSSLTLLSHFQQNKTVGGAFNNIRPKPYLSPVLFQHIRQYKAQAGSYLSILNRIKSRTLAVPQLYLFSIFMIIRRNLYLISAFSMEYSFSHTLFLHFQKYKILAIHYLCFFNNVRP